MNLIVTQRWPWFKISPRKRSGGPATGNGAGRRSGFFSLVWFVLISLTACQPASASTVNNIMARTAQPNGEANSSNLPVSTALAVQAQSATQASTGGKQADAGAGIKPQQAATRTPGARVNGVYLPGWLPQALRSAIKLPAGLSSVDQENAAAFQVAALPENQAGAVPWVYALVAPFPTVADGVRLEELKTAWTSTRPPAADSSFQYLLVDPSTRKTFEALWGEAGTLVRTAPAGASLIDVAWRMKTAFAIIPFEQLEPSWKVMEVNGHSPVRKEFDPSTYPLTVYFALSGDVDKLARYAITPLAATNRRADHLATVVLTGTTALVRGTASLMEREGMDYPARDIGPWLKDADILHVSNEVAFAENCPPPYDWVDLKFCSRPKYMQLLKDIGVDVVELTGDHLGDWGEDAIRYTLKRYKQEGLPYYGGGENLDDARKPALFEKNGNKIAFLGCNAKAIGYSTVTETQPGALHCDMEQILQEIKKLRADGYQVIMTFQHEEYYQYVALPILQKDFQAAADAGAIIVSGSQAHQPQAFELRGDSFIHYGLGNLFFDQTNQGEAPRTAFIDRHVFYEGRHISTELLTIYFVDYARSRPMTADERKTLLETVFKASGW